MWEGSGEGGRSVAKPPSWSCLSSGGLASEKDYPFLGHHNPNGCLAKKYKKVAWIQDFIMLSSNEQGMARVGAGAGGAETPEWRQTGPVMGDTKSIPLREEHSMGGERA